MNCSDESKNHDSENTPHLYYQRLIMLEQELKEFQLNYTKLVNEGERNKEILQSQIENLTAIKQKQESLLFEFEQYRQICRIGVAIVCRLCGLVIEMNEVMEHLIESHIFENEISDKTLNSNLLLSKQHLEGTNIHKNLGVKCLEYITQDASEADALDFCISIGDNQIIHIDIKDIEKNSSKLVVCTLERLFSLHSQISDTFPKIPIPNLCGDRTIIQRFLRFVTRIKVIRESSILKSFLNVE
ncbi:hypothetical protein HWI79_1814 [Cryptosporidium felis]|nr:hypothetical protein HWI79_1814 [Cryptosporidium felis]